MNFCTIILSLYELLCFELSKLYTGADFDTDMGLEAYELKMLDYLAKMREGGGMALDTDMDGISDRLLSDGGSEYSGLSDIVGVRFGITLCYG